MIEEVWVDANVVVYYLTNSPPDLAARSSALFLRAHRGEVQLRLHPLVIAEVVFLLEGFGVTRPTIFQKLLSLVLSDSVVMDQQHVVEEALLLYRDHNIDLVDAFLGALAAKGIHHVATFNIRDLQRIPGCKPVTPDAV